jgi:hypothetical protein
MGWGTRVSGRVVVIVWGGTDSRVDEKWEVVGGDDTRIVAEGVSTE